MGTSDGWSNWARYHGSGLDPFDIDFVVEWPDSFSGIINFSVIAYISWQKHQKIWKSVIFRVIEFSLSLFVWYGTYRFAHVCNKLHKTRLYQNKKCIAYVCWHYWFQRQECLLSEQITMKIRSHTKSMNGISVYTVPYVNNMACCLHSSWMLTFIIYTTVWCCYNTARSSTILHTAMLWLRLNIGCLLWRFWGNSTVLLRHRTVWYLYLKYYKVIPFCMSITRWYILVLFAGTVNLSIRRRTAFTKHTLHAYLLRDCCLSNEMPSQELATFKHWVAHLTKSRVQSELIVSQ